MLPSGELIYVSHDRSACDFKTIWLSDTCASYMIVVINHLEGNFDTGLFIIRFLKMYFSKYNLTNFLSLN